MTTRSTIFKKDPDEKLDFVIDWSEWLATGETISTSVWTVATGITEESDSNTTTTATLWLSGGTAGTDYTAANKITTSAARIAERTLTIRVVSL